MGQEARSIPFAPILALLLFAGGMLVQHQPLQSERPPSNAAVHSPNTSGQSVEARLWQDPLEAVRLDRLRRARAASAKGESSADPDCDGSGIDCHAPGWLAERIQSARKESEQRCAVSGTQGDGSAGGADCRTDTLVLAAMVFGGPYAEDAEDRRRARYALLAALMANGYEPENNRGVGYVNFGPATGLPDVLPFERYRLRRAEAHWPGYANVFVLWVTEESLNDPSPTTTSPRSRPSGSRTTAGSAKHSCDQAAGAEAGIRSRGALNRLFLCLVGDAAVTLRVIGPNSTPTAQDLWSGGSAGGAGDKRQCDAAAGELCVGRYAVSFLSPKLSTSSRPGSESGLVRFSPADQTLAQLVQRELALRGVAAGWYIPCRRADDVALVVEADTHYGRNLENEFKAALLCNPQKGDGGIGRYNEQYNSNVHVYRYFRGLDGNVAQATAETKPGIAGDGVPSRPESTAPQERAQGQSQFDYLLRMASQAEREEHWARKPVRAVIVLGSDVFDKLAVLHAMRERLPGVLFATTDMDAGYLQAEQYQWSRNLIVASGYGSRLDSKYVLQRGAPPFRDTYQTATYLAVSYALFDRPGASGTRPDESVLGACIEPARRAATASGKLFEVADGSFLRLKPLKLADDSSDDALVMDQREKTRARCVRFADDFPEDEFVEKLDTGVPPIIDWNSYRSLAILLLCLLLLAGFGYALSWCVRRFVADELPLMVSVALPLAACLGLAWFLADQPGEEPFRWLSGVSAWPSEMIRIATIVLAIFLWRRGRHHLYHADESIRNAFFPHEPSPDYGVFRPAAGWLPQWRAGRDWLRGRLHAALRCESFAACFPRLRGRSDAKIVDVNALWREYVAWVSPGAHAARVILALICFSLLLALAIYCEPPLSPVRGDASRLFDDFSEGAAVLSVVLLLVFTLDRVAISTLFLRRLFGTEEHPLPSNWDNDILRGFCGVPCSAAIEYVDLQLSVRITEAVGEIVLYPFALIVLLLAARSRLFDNWTTPWSAFAVCVFGLGLVVLSALLLRSTAERIRRHAIEQLTVFEVGTRLTPSDTGGSGAGRQHLMRASTSTRPCTREQIETMRRVAENIREGAFAPLGDQPIVKALLLPFGGAGAVGLLEYLLMAKG